MERGGGQEESNLHVEVVDVGDVEEERVDLLVRQHRQLDRVVVLEPRLKVTRHHAQTLRELKAPI